jgi:hypothetical protein
MWALANGFPSLRALPHRYHIPYMVFFIKILPVTTDEISFYVEAIEVLLPSMDFTVVSFDF